MNSNEPGKLISLSMPSPLHNDVFISQHHKDFLRRDNPELLRLREEYSAFKKNHNADSQWDEAFCTSQINFPYFRGDNAYIWQVRNNNTAFTYNMTAKYVSSIDRLSFLHKTYEDGAFGVFTYLTDPGFVVSRDLLDSIMELYFLENVLGISQGKAVRIIDVGAGYGRLAHRAVQCIDNIERFYCVDAIADSTFLSKFYLDYQRVSEKCSVIPLYEARNTIQNARPDIAINIHSFSECSIDSIEYWIEMLSAGKVKYLMIAPNNYKTEGGKHLLSLEPDSSHVRFEKVLHKYGYHLMVKMPKYLDYKIQAYGVSPTYYHLYELVD